MAIDSDVKGNIDLVSNANDVLPGDINTHKVDIKDIETMETLDKGAGASALCHEIIEQYKLAEYGITPPKDENGNVMTDPGKIKNKAHSHAEKYERNLNDIESTEVIFDGYGGINETVTKMDVIISNRDSSKTIRKYKVQNGNIISRR